MEIIEVKNNFARIRFDATIDKLVLSVFVILKDSVNSFIGQIIHLEANTKGSFAIIKLLFLFDNQGVITKYNGSIPDINSAIEIVPTKELLEILPVENPIIFGELAQQKSQLTLDSSIFEEKMLVCCDDEADKEIFIKNSASQLINSGKNILIFDLIGNIDCIQNQIIAGDDLKLPLNYDAINFIYSELEDASAEAKAKIQEVLWEVQNYIKDLPEGFIPFETFKEVVDEQYKELELTELLLLKNKLLKYYEEGIFAQDETNFNFIEDTLANKSSIIDLSNIDGKIQKEFIKFVYNSAENSDNNLIFILNVEDENSDKKLLKEIFTSKKVKTIIMSGYNYKYLQELKQLSKNLILFAPIQQQNDFASYNVFLDKLNASEFIIYGQKTQHMPLIIALEDLSEIIKKSEQTEAPMQKTQAPLDENVDAQIKQDVDEIYLAQNDLQTEANDGQDNPETPDIQPVDSQSTEDTDELTDDDLDFIEEIHAENDFIDNEAEEEIEYSETNDSENTENQLDTNAELESEAIEAIEVEDDTTISGEEETTIEDDSSIVFEQLVPDEEVLEENIEQQNETEIQQQESKNSFADLMAKEEAEIEDSQLDEEELVDEAEVNVDFEEEEAPAVDILPANLSSSPIVPVYSSDIEPQAQSDNIDKGDIVMHQKYGKGIVEKMISYGSKTLCSINFDNVGRRLLDPNLAELKKL